MRKIFSLVVLIISLSLNVALATITQTPNLIPIENALQQADLDTLVVFDVDDVLITPKDQILKPEHKKFLESLNKGIEGRYSEEEAQKLFSIIMLARSNKFVDPKMVSLIQSLQKKGVRVIALTNAWTGSLGYIPSFEDWRLDEIQSFGYLFKDSWKGIQTKIFSNLKSKDPTRFPLFKKGVIFTCNLSKGELLKAFLNYATFTPKKIIFTDDKKKHLESVEAFSKEQGIPFIGFQYTAVAEKSKTPLNKKRAKSQFEILEKEHKWLSDEKWIQHEP